MIPFHISNISSDVGDQHWVQKYLFIETLNEHAPIKVRTIKENHVPYMHSELRKLMYRRNMLKKTNIVKIKKIIISLINIKGTEISVCQ